MPRRIGGLFLAKAPRLHVALQILPQKPAGVTPLQFIITHKNDPVVEESPLGDLRLLQMNLQASSDFRAFSMACNLHALQSARSGEMSEI